MPSNNKKYSYLFKTKIVCILLFVDMPLEDRGEAKKMFCNHLVLSTSTAIAAKKKTGFKNQKGSGQRKTILKYPPNHHCHFDLNATIVLNVIYPFYTV